MAGVLYFISPPNMMEICTRLGFNATETLEVTRRKLSPEVKLLHFNFRLMKDDRDYIIKVEVSFNSKTSAPRIP